MTATKRPPRRWSASTRSTRATPRTGASSSSSRAARPAESSPAPWGELAQRRARADRPEVAQPADQSWPPLPRPAAVAWASRRWPWAKTGRTSATDSAGGKRSSRSANGSAITPSSSACLASSSWSSRTSWPAPASTPKYVPPFIPTALIAAPLGAQFKLGVIIYHNSRRPIRRRVILSFVKLRFATSSLASFV